MSVFYCHRCDRYVDSDFEGYSLIGDEEACDNCMAEEEEAEEESDDAQ